MDLPSKPPRMLIEDMQVKLDGLKASLPEDAQVEIQKVRSKLSATSPESMGESVSEKIASVQINVDALLSHFQANASSVVEKIKGITMVQVFVDTLKFELPPTTAEERNYILHIQRME